MYAQELTNMFTNITRGSFNDLSDEAKVFIVFRSLRSNLNSIKWWNTRLEDKDISKQSRANAEAAITDLESTLPGLQKFLWVMAQRGEGRTAEVEWDQSGSDDEGELTIRTEWSPTTVNAKPHAWAMDRLITNNEWDEELDMSSDYPVVIRDLENIADRTFGQMVSRIIVSMSEEVKWHKKTDGRDFEIFGLSPLAQEVSRIHDERLKFVKLTRIACQYPPMDMTKKCVERAVKRIKEYDDELKFENELEEQRHMMKGIAREAIRDAARIAMIDDLTRKLKANGISDDVIGAMVAKMMS